MLRKIKRNLTKNIVGSNHIQNRWRHDQIRRYGYNKWYTLYRHCTGKHLEGRIPT